MKKKKLLCFSIGFPKQQHKIRKTFDVFCCFDQICASIDDIPSEIHIYIYLLLYSTNS